MLPEVASAWSPSEIDAIYIQFMQDPHSAGFAAITAVGMILGLLGGGGSILALPIFMLTFQHPTDVAMAESLAVVSVGAAVGFMSHLRAGTVDLAVASPFAVLAMTGSYFGSQAAIGVPQSFRLALFFMIAVSSSAIMLRGALREIRGSAATAPPAEATVLTPASAGAAPTPTTVPPASFPLPLGGDGRRRFGPMLATQAALVGVLTSVAGTGGGFLVVPALTALAGLPVSLL